jgi:putative FmdB family regulatory protein
MPLYEYKCQKCKNRFERIERVSSQHDGVCPKCGGAAHRLLGAPALQFKGSGWYVNDYAKGNGSPPSESEKETASATASTNETKSETTSDAKVEKSAPKKAEPKVA